MSFEKPKELSTEESIMQKLKEDDPKKNIALAAIDKLRDPEEMKAFFREYAEWQKETINEDPEKVAKENIGYWLSRISDKELLEKWEEAVPGIIDSLAEGGIKESVHRVFDRPEE